MPVDQNDQIAQAVAAARQPDLVYDSDPIAPTYGEQERAAGARLHDYLANLPSSIMQNLQRPQTISPAALVKSRFTQQGQAEASRGVADAAQAAAQPFVSAATAPGRAYRGEIPEDQMIDEAKNMAGQLMTGSFAVGAPSALREGLDPNVLRTFAGPASKTADIYAQRKAGLLKDIYNVSPEDIWRQTKWMQDPAKLNWMYEIKDPNFSQAIGTDFADEQGYKKASQDWLNKIPTRKSDLDIAGDYYEQYLGMPRAKMFTGQNPELDEQALAFARAYPDTSSIKLGNLINHPELFEAYPELSDMPVYRENSKAGLYGRYDPEKHEISTGGLNDRYSSIDPYNAYSTLMHEVNHAISHREGRPVGGNPQYANQLQSTIIDKKLGLLNDQIDDINQQLSGLDDASEDAMALKKQRWDIRDRKKELINSFVEPYEAYQRLQDEVLSRLVQNRIGLANPEKHFPLSEDPEAFGMDRPVSQQLIHPYWEFSHWGRASGGRTLGNNAIDNAMKLALGGRAHFDDGGDVRGGDSVGGLRGDTGGYSGDQGAANEARMGDSPGGLGGDTGSYSSGDVGSEQGRQNEQTARDQLNQQNERRAQENDPQGYAVRTGDVSGGLGGDTGRFSGYTSPQQGQQDTLTAALQGNIQRARQQQQQAFDRYMNQVQGPESGGQGAAYNPKTGAFGAFQLMPNTALGLMQKYAPGDTYRQAEGISNPADVAGGGLNTGPGYVGLTPQEQLRNITVNQDLQRTLAEGLTRDNMATLSNAGVPINSGSLYTAHLLGAGDALKVLQSDPNTPLEQTGVNPQAITNNNLSGMTAGQLLARSGSQMAAAPAGGISSAGGYGRLAENTTDNSGARINDVSGSPDAAITAAKTAASTQQPSILDKIFGSTQDQIDKLASEGKYAGMDKSQYTAQFSPNDPSAVKERIIYDNGQPKVDYYTKDLGQALFSDPLKALGEGIGGLFKPSSSDNGFRSSATQPSGSNIGPFDRSGRGQDAISQAVAAAQPTATQTPAPYIAQVGNYNAQLPSTTGMSAEQWAAANTGGDMSRVNGRIKYVNGAPMLEYYAS